MSHRKAPLGLVIVFVVMAASISTGVALGEETASMATPTTIFTSTTTPPQESQLPPPPTRYIPDPSSPPTTVPPKPILSAPEDPPQSRFTVTAMPLIVKPGDSRQAYRIVVDADGQVVAEGRPGEPLRAPSDQSEAVAAGQYQVDYVILNDNTTQDVYNIDLWIYIAPTQRSDPDTWSGGQRKTSGYVWFPAVQANMGSTPSSDLFHMHAGIACGNGISNQWYFTWGGYYAPAWNSLGPGLGNSIRLYEDKWYRVRIWRLAQSGNNWPWGAWVMDWNSGQEWYAGAWYLTYGRMISNAQYWTELAEPNVGVTDYLGTHNMWVEYRDPSGRVIYKQGWANYQDTVNNTNLRRSGAHINRYTIDDREVVRTNPPWTLLFNNP